MQAHYRRRLPPRFPRPYLTAVLSPFARHPAAYPRSLSIRRFMQPPTPLHHPPLSTQGHPNAFPPPTTAARPLSLSPPRPSLPLFLRWHPRQNNANHRRPSRRGVIGDVHVYRSCIRARRKVRAYTYSVFARLKIIEKMLGESGVAGIPPWRRRPRPSLPRSTVISSPPSPPSRVYAILSRFLVLAYVARYVFNTGQLVGK